VKRKSRYSDEIIAYAVAERSRGVKWKAISEGIARHFAIKSPTERQMRDWFSEFGGDPEDPEKILRENLVKIARATTPLAAFATQKYLLEQVPNLVEAWEQGKDPWTAGGMMVLSILETTVGTDKFNQIQEEYRNTHRDDISPKMGR
jgi:hypothetical protein